MLEHVQLERIFLAHYGRIQDTAVRNAVQMSSVAKS